MLGDDADRRWHDWALLQLADDHGALHRPDLIEWPGTFASGSRILLLDESRRPSGSLKHTTMQLVFRRLVDDRAVRRDRSVVMASAGNAAVAGAYWCVRIARVFSDLDR